MLGAVSWDRVSAEGPTPAPMGEWRWVSALDTGERSWEAAGSFSSVI